MQHSQSCRLTRDMPLGDISTGVKKSATYKERCIQLPNLSTTTKKSTTKSNFTKFLNGKIGQINIPSESDGLRVYFILEQCKHEKLDVVCL